MILSCSACSTRYLVDPALLGPEGREVRCAKCGHQWTQKPPEDLPAAELPPLEPGIRAIPEGLANQPYVPAPGANLPAVPRRRARMGNAWAWLLLILVLGVFVGGVAARNEIVATWPPAAKLYENLGLAAPPPGSGIELRSVASSRTEEDGAPVLVIHGEVANVSSAVRQVPKMRAALREAGKEVQSWTFQGAQSRLLPGESAPFVTRFKNPSPAATDLTITFTDDD